MVDFEQPTNESIAPSEDIPQLTINHDVAADLDSSSAFEGNFPASSVAPRPGSIALT